MNYLVQEYFIRSSTGKDLYVKKWYEEGIKKYKGISQVIVLEVKSNVGK